MELSNRMKAVAQMVPAGHIAADVGCDHGFVSIYLAQNGICPFVYAADVRPGPLAAAKAHILESGLSDTIMTVLSDGLENVPVGKEVRAACPGADVMIAAGMGGRLTVRILEGFPEKTQQLSWLILEPQSEVWLVRRWLGDHGFVITEEAMVAEEGKYYPVIKARNGRQEESVSEKMAELERDVCEALARAGLREDSCREACDRFGPVLIAQKNRVLLSFLEHTMEQDAALLEQMPLAAENSLKAGRIEMRRQELYRRIALERAVTAILKSGNIKRKESGT